ncbi:MAG TPA: type II toxin-antitoxin system HicB family antitoxin [Thermodesulfobacteriota bacterium]|nr:type II toxin-antitoxin system HicB family antitoxin [Thermodesulfobacteriota bacterium]
MLKYKGYKGSVEFDDDAGLLHGEVLDTRDVITFQGKTVEELRKAFRDSIDDYLEYCAERNEKPEKPFSGKFVVRLPSTLHHRAYIKAMEQGKSLNQLVVETLEKVI